jgi:hypothetical protein
MIGNEIFSRVTYGGGANFNINDKPAGVYFLQVTTQKKKVLTTKLLKE